MTETLTWKRLAVGDGRSFASAETGDGTLNLRPQAGLEPARVEFAATGARWPSGIGRVLTHAYAEALFDWVATAPREVGPEAAIVAAGFALVHHVDGWAGRIAIMTRHTPDGMFQAELGATHVAMSFERDDERGCRNLLMLSTNDMEAAPGTPAALPARLGGMPGFAAMAVEMARLYELSGATAVVDERIRAAEEADDEDDDEHGHDD